VQLLTEYSKNRKVVGVVCTTFFDKGYVLCMAKIMSDWSKADEANFHCICICLMQF